MYMKYSNHETLKAIQPKIVIFKNKKNCLRWNSNPQHSAFQADALPTELLRPLSCTYKATELKAKCLNLKIPFTVYVLTVGWCHPIKFLSISHTSQCKVVSN